MKYQFLLISSGLLLSLFMSTSALAESARFKGQYTLGPDANTFCLDSTEECFFVGADTREETLEELRAAFEKGDTSPEGTCMILYGSLDRELAVAGFDVEHDGTIKVQDVLGRCDEANYVVHADIRNRTWQLTGLNDRRPDTRPRPTIAFSEYYVATVTTRCSQHVGHALLQDHQVVINNFRVRNRSCETMSDGEKELIRLLLKKPVASLDEKNILHLDDGRRTSTWKLVN